MTITNIQILWTCLPNGVQTTGVSPTAQLSLVVTPQVFSTALANSPDTIQNTIFQDWPAYVRAVASAGGFQIQFGSTDVPLSTATMVDNISPSPQFQIDGETLWPAIFPFSTPVKPANLAAAVPAYRILSYDAGAIALGIRAAHQYAVQSHATHGKLVLTGTDPYSVFIAEKKKAKAVHHKMVSALRGAPRGSTHETLKQAYVAETGSLGLGYELMRHALFFDPAKHRTDRNPDALPAVGSGDDAGASPVFPADFNSLIAHLGGQPQLQRKLGLIIDLTVPIPAGIGLLSTSATSANTTFGVYATIITPSNLPTSYTSRFPQVATTLGTVTNIQPSTRADIAQSFFRTGLNQHNPVTATSGGSFNNGFLPLGDTGQYTMYSEDTEGTPFKVESATSSVAATDETPVLPALRTAGLVISQGARETVLADPVKGLLAKQQQLTNVIVNGSVMGSAGADANDQVLYAEDLVRGYAVDVAVGPNPSPAQFQKLCLRDSSLYFPGLTSGPTTFVLSDEGYTKATAASSTTAPTASGGSGDATSSDGYPTDLNLHTALFGWEGWSLAVQRPGRAITASTPPGDTVQVETPVQPINASQTASFPSAQITVRARSGSLTRLRFGQQYTLRARAIDLAGNDMSIPSQPVTSPSPSTMQSSTMQYLRYEPVPNPVLVLQAALTEGEHVENLVIRSNPWGNTPMDAVAYAAKANASLNPMNTYAADCARWVAPPKGSWNQAEASYAFDASFNVMSAALEADVAAGLVTPGVPYTSASSVNALNFFNAKNALFLASQKEAGVFTDSYVWNSADTTSTTPSAQNPVQIITPPTAQNLPPPTDPGQPLGTGQYNILANYTNGVRNNPPTQVYVPYLPDANAQGIHLQQLNMVQSAGLPAGSLVASSTGIASKPSAPSSTAPSALQVVSAATRTFLPRQNCSWPEIDLPQIVLEQVPWTPSPPTPAPFGPPSMQLNALPAITWGTVTTPTNTSVSGLDPTPPPALPPLAPLAQPWSPQSGAPTTLPSGFNPPPIGTPIAFQLAPGQQMSFLYGSSVANVNLMASSNPSLYPNTVAYAPSRVITLVHAVQQPYPPNNGTTIAAPTTQGGPGVTFVGRKPGDTSVVFTGSFEVDGGTANGVVLTTEWGDFVDVEMTSGVQTAPNASNMRYVGKSGRLAEWTLGLTDSACNFQTTITAPAVTPTTPSNPLSPTTQETPALIQQCGDTKTRQICFQATATSRFREYFPASLQSNGANFQTATPTIAPTAWECLTTPGIGVRIPATAPPHAPKILHVVPTYAWGSQVVVNKTTNVRTGRGLRVFVDRPWFTTGDTEMLGVVVNNAGTAPASVGAYVSQWGPDPILFPQDDTLAALDATQLVGGQTYTGIPLLEVPGQTVTVVAFPPQAFDQVRNLWYFDIEFATTLIEAPFVRLALMRFQPNALGNPSFANPSNVDLRMSNVVHADMVKLTPDRTATYKTTPGNDTITVSVQGQVYATESWSGGGGTLSQQTAAPAASYGRAMYAQIQEAPAGVTSPGEFDWTTVAGPFALEAYQTQGEAGTSTTLTFSLAIPKPTSGLNASAKHQLLLTEHEVFVTDQSVAFPTPTVTEAGFTPAGSTVESFPGNIALSSMPSPPPGAGSTEPFGTTSRIVFSDIFPLPY